VAAAVDSAFEAAKRGIYGKARFSTEAIFLVPGSKSEIALERRAIHLFLAEYERTLILRDNGQEVLRLAAAEDSGGYSRMNVYRVSDSVFYLRGEMSFDRYLLDTSRPSVTRESLGETPSAAQFIGAFDRDCKGWRFIPKYERAEQKPKI
jgi:hypothetical protein